MDDPNARTIRIPWASIGPSNTTETQVSISSRVFDRKGDLLLELAVLEPP
jgi:hypothetical protein